MTLRCIIFDFDGTLTDVHAESAMFLPAYQRDIGALLNMSEPDLLAAWHRVRARIFAAPERHGWRCDGHIVAPAHGDPYVLPGCIANLLLDEAHVLPDVEKRMHVLQETFYRNYVRTPTHFRAETRELLTQLLAEGLQIFVVSNSATDAVNQKIAKLGETLASAIRVHGHARKFVLADRPADRRFTAVPETHHVEGLQRAMYLRRGYYYDALAAVWDEAGVTPEESLVCGDNFELDLAMPLALGAQGFLVVREGTPEYEAQAARYTNRCHAGPLRELMMLT